MTVIDRELSPIALPASTVRVDLGDKVFLPRIYGEYNRDSYLPKIERVCAALGALGVASHDEIEQTLTFAERAFALYKGKEPPHYGGSHVFIVPTFVSSSQEKGEYNSQITTSYPIAKYLTGKALVDTIVGVPPCIIESYPVDETDRQAHVLFAPVMPDMALDLKSGARLTAQKIVSDTALFAKDKLGASVVGLGATLPLATNLGKSIDIEGLTTTTGHGGTVHLLSETVDRVIAEKGLPGNCIGVVGANGTIGRASLSLLLERYPSAKFVVADTAFIGASSGELLKDKIGRFLQTYEPADRERITVKPTAEDVFAVAKINVSAITGSIDVSQTKSMEGVIIVDDSQPGAFDRNQIEAKGGKVVWVVGQDYSKTGQLTRLGPMNFGDIGLMRSKDLFGCEAEAAVVGKFDTTSAVRERVTPAIAHRIGELFMAGQIGISDTLQSYGRPVYL